MIDDFDAIGGGAKQDYIKADRHDVKISRSGHDTVLEFADGSIMTLLHVDKADITGADFHLL